MEVQDFKIIGRARATNVKISNSNVKAVIYASDMYVDKYPKGVERLQVFTNG